MRIVAFSDHLDAFNGGTKVYNLWTKLMRENSIDAVMSTPTGGFPFWLCNHQPVIPRHDIKNDDILWTTWLNNSELDKHQWYYMDCELNGTLLYKDLLDKFMQNGNLLGVATHSRYIQSWYMANYGFRPTLINEWSDTEVFYPDISSIVPGRCGFIYEPEYSKQASYVKLLQDKGFDIMGIRGDELQVANALRTCDFFIGFNDGKHPLWGEGCPRTQQEAMHCGCVVIAFDCLGNREYLYHGHTGFFIEDVTEIPQVVGWIRDSWPTQDIIRGNSMNFVKDVFSDKYKLPLIRKFFNVN